MNVGDSSIPKNPILLKLSSAKDHQTLGLPAPTLMLLKQATVLRYHPHVRPYHKHSAPGDTPPAKPAK